jgi:hypothetical protein
MEKDNLVSTGIGLIQRDNANWLYTKGVLTRKGLLKGSYVRGLSKDHILLYSYLRLVMDDIANSIPTLPSKVYLTLDDYIQLARVGHIEKGYEEEGMDLVYKATYPMVGDLERMGKEVFVKNQPKKKASWSDEEF